MGKQQEKQPLFMTLFRTWVIILGVISIPVVFIGGLFGNTSNSWAFFVLLIGLITILMFWTVQKGIAEREKSSLYIYLIVILPIIYIITAFSIIPFGGEVGGINPTTFIKSYNDHANSEYFTVGDFFFKLSALLISLILGISLILQQLFKKEKWFVKEIKDLSLKKKIILGISFLLLITVLYLFLFSTK